MIVRNKKCKFLFPHYSGRVTLNKADRITNSYKCGIIHLINL